MTARPPAPALTPAEAARLSRPAVDIAADEREETVARAIYDADPSWSLVTLSPLTWDEISDMERACNRRLARAALAAARPPADDPAAAEERRELIRSVREGAWRDGYDACRRGEQRHNPYRSPR